MQAKYDKLAKTVIDLSADVTKAVTGNKSAAIRVRSALLEIKGMAHELRGLFAPSNMNKEGK